MGAGAGGRTGPASGDGDADAGFAVVGDDLAGRRRLRVAAADGRITAVEDLGAATGSGPRLAPGLVDVQVNGAAGYDLNAGSLTVDRVRALDAHLVRHGVTTFFPAVTTNAPDRIARNLDLIRRAVDEADRSERLGIGGIHLEGPFISPESGPRGAHDARYVRPPEWELFQRWQEAAGGMIRILTCSPEWPQACRFIERVVATGVRVAIGHTAAEPSRIRDAVAAGATMSTHLGNGSHPMLPRHDNYVWEQAACDELTASLIADGEHLPLALLGILLRAKGRHAILISDASTLAGLEPGDYTTENDREVRLTPEGRLVLRSDPALLAGSARLLPYCVAHVVREGLADLECAWEMASTRPAGLLGLDPAPGIAVGAPADLLAVEWNGDLKVREVYRAGRRIPD